jgi:L-asparaginase II
VSVKLVEVTRGQIVESIHRGDIAVVRCDGNVLYTLGSGDHLSFMRSASKPIQAIAVLEYGIVEKFGLELSEVAMLMSSHSGEKVHIDILNQIIRKIGIDHNVLQCGAHPPLSADAAKELVSKGQSFNRLHCNCSGKHLGQIAAVKVKGLPLEDYYKPGSEIQKDAQDIISKFSGVKADQIKLGIDGCGIPVYGIPIRNMALAYANLCNESFMNGRYAKSQNYVISAMTNNPEMIAGKERLDTALMSHFGDRLIAKFGDEGVYCIGLIGKGIGIALKIEDGHTRAVGPAILETLRQLGVIKIEEMAPLKDFFNPFINNHKGEKVGEIKAVFPGQI